MGISHLKPLWGKPSKVTGFACETRAETVPCREHQHASLSFPHLAFKKTCAPLPALSHGFPCLLIWWHTLQSAFVQCQGTWKEQPWGTPGAQRAVLEVGSAACCSRHSLGRSCCVSSTPQISCALRPWLSILNNDEILVPEPRMAEHVTVCVHVQGQHREEGLGPASSVCSPTPVRPAGEVPWQHGALEAPELVLPPPSSIRQFN